MECPLPIDWLDWIEDPRNQLLAVHLESCLSCRAVVALVHTADEPKLRFQEPPKDSASHFLLEDASDISPAAGELWITGPADDDLDRAVVVLLTDRHREFDRDWYEVAGVETTIEQATEFDLLIERSETSLNLPLRFRFDLQGYVAASDLCARTGALTDRGKEIVAAALEGLVDESRWGLALDGPHDERLVRPDRNGATIRQLQMLYRTRAAAAEDAELTLAAALKHARNEQELSRAELSEKLAERVGLAELTAKVKRYYADLENGLLNPSGLRPALINGIAQTLRVPRQQLEGLRDAWTQPTSGGAAPAFARSTTGSTTAVVEAAEESWDAVDDLFFGGRTS
jgi:transcriptional regulator with XRE-family HTH domain